jgi:hypothetical protein
MIKKQLNLIKLLNLKNIKIICLLFIVYSCNKHTYTYNSSALKRYDLKGNVKSLVTNINFQNSIFDCCDSGLDQILSEEFNYTKFNKFGLIEKLNSKSVICKYDKNGDVLSKRFINKNRIEYGFTKFRYYKNSFYKNNCNYDVDSSRIFLDTIFVIEKGTSNKFEVGWISDLEFGIERKFVLDKNGYLLYKMTNNCDGGITKYIYNNKKRLLYKIELFDDMIRDSIFFNYNKNGYLSSIISKKNTNLIRKNIFDFKKFDDYGNWTELIILSNDNKVKIIRKIEYY